MIPTSIDGTDITGATIDGTDVTEITVDGDTVFSAGFEPVGSPIAYWPMDEGSGSVANDNIASADINLNGATFVADATAVGGFVTDFDGSTTADVPVSDQPPLGDSGTFLATIEFDSITGIHRIWSVDTNGSNVILIRLDGSNNIQLILPNTFIDFSFSFNTGEKYRIALYWDNGDVRVFVDGNREHTDTYSGTVDGNNNTWNFMGGGGFEEVDGLADAFIMYDTGLSDTDISTDFSNQPWS